MAAVSKKFSDLLSADKIAKVVQVASNLGLNPNWLLAVMYFETGRTFSPSITNQIGSVGLIQFTRDKAGVQYKTIAGKQYKLADLAKMSFIDQMDVVEAYYKEAKGKRAVSSFTDTYLITFFPAALGKPDSYVFETKGLSASLIAKQNPAFDRNKDGKITKSEVTEYFRKMYTDRGFNFDTEINIGKTASPVLTLAVFFYSLLCLTICLT